MLIRYAGYCQPNGTIIGAPAQTELTEICQHFGWQRQGSQFDVLPLIIQMPGQKPQWFELPKKAVLEVPISHPEDDWFADLGLKWHAIACCSRLALRNWRNFLLGCSLQRLVHER